MSLLVTRRHLLILSVSLSHLILSPLTVSCAVSMLVSQLSCLSDCLTTCLPHHSADY